MLFENQTEPMRGLLMQVRGLCDDRQVVLHIPAAPAGKRPRKADLSDRVAFHVEGMPLAEVWKRLTSTPPTYRWGMARLLEDAISITVGTERETIPEVA